MFNWGYLKTVEQGATVRDQEPASYTLLCQTNPTEKSKTRHMKETYQSNYGNYDFLVIGGSSSRWLMTSRV